MYAGVLPPFLLENSHGIQPKQGKRLGSEGTHALMAHPFFQSVDWDQLERGGLPVSDMMMEGVSLATAILDRALSELCCS